MPTSKTKNLLYRLALPFLAPSISEEPVALKKGHSLCRPDDLSAILRRNHISGSALHFQAGNESCDVFSRAVHTDMTPDERTFFRVASITKMAVALVSVCLMDKGILDPDAPLSTLLPDGAKVPELRGILFRHLLSHTSGLADPPGLEIMLNESKPYPEAVAGCRVAAPGSAFRYSNLGFGLIGCVFESLLSRPLERVMQSFLFGPLHMNATLEACSVPEKQIMPVIRMLPYHAGAGLRVTSLGKIPLDHPDPLRHYGHTAGSMYSDLPSLVLLLQCVRNGGKPLVSDRYAGYMQKQVSEYGSSSPTLSYGSGLLIVRDPRISSRTVYGHQGFAYGCVDGAFWEEDTGNLMVSLNGGCSEARTGRFSIANLDLCRFAFRKELPQWKQSAV